MIQKPLLTNIGAKLRQMVAEDWRGEDERNTLGMAGYWLEKLADYEAIIDAKIKAQNAECLMALKIIMMEQDLETIRKIITKGGTTEDVLKFLDTPNA
jgi:hypothetical protein